MTVNAPARSIVYLVYEPYVDEDELFISTIYRAFSTRRLAEEFVEVFEPSALIREVSIYDVLPLKHTIWRGLQWLAREGTILIDGPDNILQGCTYRLVWHHERAEYQGNEGLDDGPLPPVLTSSVQHSPQGITSHHGCYRVDVRGPSYEVVVAELDRRAAQESARLRERWARTHA